MAAVVNYCCFAGTAQLLALPLARAGQVVPPPISNKMMMMAVEEVVDDGYRCDSRDQEGGDRFG